VPARRRMARPGRAAACADRCAHCWPGGSAPWRPAGMALRSGRCCSWRWPPAVTAGPHRTVSRSRIAARRPRAASAIIFACTGRAAGRRPAADPPRQPLSYQGRPGLLCTTGRKSPALPLAAGLWRTGAQASMPTRWRGRGAGRYGGRCIMARSGVFYVVKAMERTVAGADAPRAPARQPADREPTAGARSHGRSSSLARRMLAAVQRSLGGAPGPAGRGRHRVGGAARAD
jgi:hypothetical protein